MPPSPSTVRRLPLSPPTRPTTTTSATPTSQTSFTCGCATRWVKSIPTCSVRCLFRKHRNSSLHPTASVVTKKRHESFSRKDWAKLSLRCVKRSILTTHSRFTMPLSSRRQMKKMKKTSYLHSPPHPNLLPQGEKEQKGKAQTVSLSPRGRGTKGEGAVASTGWETMLEGLLNAGFSIT